MKKKLTALILSLAITLSFPAGVYAKTTPAYDVNEAMTSEDKNGNISTDGCNSGITISTDAADAGVITLTAKQRKQFAGIIRGLEYTEMMLKSSHVGKWKTLKITKAMRTYASIAYLEKAGGKTTKTNIKKYAKKIFNSDQIYLNKNLIESSNGTYNLYGWGPVGFKVNKTMKKNSAGNYVLYGYTTIPDYSDPSTPTVNYTKFKLTLKKNKNALTGYYIIGVRTYNYR